MTSPAVPPSPERDLSAEILARANVLVWKATVQHVAGEFEWHFQVAPNAAANRLFPLVTTRDPHVLWVPEVIPDLAAMNERSQRAMLEGASGYQHEFRVRDGDRIVWLAEDVAIERLGPNRWSLVGVATDVTARREAEELSRRNAARLHNLLERADCMFWEAHVQRIDGDVHWTFNIPVSRLSRTLFGSRIPDRCEGITGKISATIYGGHPVLEQAELDRRSMHALENDLPGYQQEFRVQAPDKVYWLQEQVSIVRNGPDEWSLVGVTIDVTARREAEAAREATEQRLHEVLARADCMIWEANVQEQPDGRFVWHLYTPPSHLYRTIFGYDPSPQQARLWSYVSVPEIEKMHERSAAAMRSGAAGYSQEFRVLQGNETRWLFEQVAIRRNGERSWRLTGVVTDITARRAAEIALATETERLAVTLRSMSEGVITTDTSGRVQFLNRAAADFLGTTPAAATGGEQAQLCRFVNTRSGNGYTLPLEQALQEGLAFDLPVNTALLQGADHSRLVAGHCAPVRDASSRIIGAVLVLDDITERHRLDERLQRASKLESVGVLAGGIAHDFNNILTSIMGNISLALLDLPDHSPAAQVLADARKATTRARELTQQLLTFAKGGDPVRTALHLPELIIEVARFALHGSSVACEFDLPDELWTADADKGQFGQIIQNLVLNAVQATGEHGRLRIGAANTEITDVSPLPLSPGPYVRVTVADNGQGISPENLSRVFDPYFTTKERGHGLGLATVYSIIQRHGGHIDVESTVGLGTSFSFWLPAQRNAPARANRPDSGSTSSIAGSCKGRVLFMDDEPAIRKLGGALLRRLGLDVEVAADGAEAVRLYQAAIDAGRRFDAVVVDLTIPGGMGGREAVEILQRIDPGVRAIVSSGYSSDPVLANHRAYGFCGMVAKPYQVEQFAEVIREAIGQPPSA